MNGIPTNRYMYVTSLIWSVPISFVATIITTAVVFVVSSATTPGPYGVDVLGAVFSGILWGILIFIPSCIASVPLVGFSIASIRIFAADRQRRRGQQAAS